MKSRKTKSRSGLGLARRLGSEILFTARCNVRTLTGYEPAGECDVLLVPDDEAQDCLAALRERHHLRWDGAKEQGAAEIKATDDWLNGRIAMEELQQQLHSGEYREEDWDK